MSCFLKGITVQLHVKTQTGTDPFGAPEYTETLEDVENVLVAPTTSANKDSDTETDLHNKRVSYTLGIPKGDTHNWEDTFVDFFGQTFRTVGYSVQGIDAMIPLDWNRKVYVELRE